MDFNAPADSEYGGGRPTAFKSADGSWFFASLEKQGGSSGPLRLIVYHVDASGKLLGAWAESGIIGQGGLDLQGDGSLTACGYTAHGDNATMRIVAVPDWTPWPKGRDMASGEVVVPSYLYDRPYTDISQFGGDINALLRANRQARALHESRLALVRGGLMAGDAATILGTLARFRAWFTKAEKE